VMANTPTSTGMYVTLNWPPPDGSTVQRDVLCGPDMNREMIN